VFIIAVGEGDGSVSSQSNPPAAAFEKLPSSIALTSRVSAQAPGGGRAEMLESGDQAMLPEGMIKIPGVPFAMTEDDGRRMEDAKQQLEQNGYVDQSDAQPMASIYLQMMRSEVGQGRSGQTTNVYEATDFDLSNFGAGKVRAELLTPESEAYVIDNDPMLIRVYSDTALGDIFIQEGKGSKMGVVGNAPPNVHIGGHRGYSTRVRFAGGQFATIVIMPTDTGSMLVEIGTDVEGLNQVSEMKALLTGLLTEKEE